MPVQIVDDEAYAHLLKSDAAVVAFGIASCVPCNEYDPILEEASGRFCTVSFGKARLHVPGACREIKRQHTFETFPTTHFYKEGRLVHVAEEKLEREALAACIEQYLLA